MTTTASYGTWANHGDHYSVSVEATLADYISGDPEWRERVESTGAFAKMAAAYRAEINAALPDAVALCGDEFYGPAYPDEGEFDDYPTNDGGGLDISACIEQAGIDLGAIVERHDPDLTIYTLVSAHPGDRVPGHELADPDCPEVPDLLEQDEVTAFFAAQGYGPDEPDELMYLVTEDQTAEIPDGFPALTVRI